MRKVMLLNLGLVLASQINAASIGIAIPFASGGNTSGAGPFGSLEPARFQEVYAASAFGPISAGGGFITAFGFAGADSAQGNGVEIITNLQINFSTTSKNPDGLSSVFADNIGLDEKAVLGPKAYAYGATRGGFSLITLDHPFFYDPAAGNLLVDIRNYGVTFAGSQMFMLAGEVQLGDSVSLVSSTPDVNSPTGFASTGGLLTDFVVTPVPEPSILGFAGFGVSALLAFRYIQTRTKNRKGKQKWH